MTLPINYIFQAVSSVYISTLHYAKKLKKWKVLIYRVKRGH